MGHPGIVAWIAEGLKACTTTTTPGLHYNARPALQRQACTTTPGLRHNARSPASGLEQLDRVAVGIFDLDLLAAGADLHIISKTQA